MCVSLPTAFDRRIRMMQIATKAKTTNSVTLKPSEPGLTVNSSPRTLLTTAASVHAIPIPGVQNCHQYKPLAEIGDRQQGRQGGRKAGREEGREGGWGRGEGEREREREKIMG